MILLGHSIHLQAPGESVDLQRLRAIGKTIKPVPKSAFVVWMLLCGVRLGYRYTPAILWGVCGIGVQLNIC
jgi:hypothetical protein